MYQGVCVQDLSCKFYKTCIGFYISEQKKSFIQLLMVAVFTSPCGLGYATCLCMCVYVYLFTKLCGQDLSCKFIRPVLVYTQRTEVAY